MVEEVVRTVESLKTGTEIEDIIWPRGDTKCDALTN